MALAKQKPEKAINCFCCFILLSAFCYFIFLSCVTVNVLIAIVVSNSNSNSSSNSKKRAKPVERCSSLFYPFLLFRFFIVMCTALCGTYIFVAIAAV